MTSYLDHYRQREGSGTTPLTKMMMENNSERRNEVKQNRFIGWMAAFVLAQVLRRC